MVVVLELVEEAAVALLQGKVVVAMFLEEVFLFVLMLVLEKAVVLVEETVAGLMGMLFLPELFLPELFLVELFLVELFVVIL